MYARNAVNRGAVDLEKLVACPTCGAKKGEACSRGVETTEVPHNKRAIAAAASRSVATDAPKAPQEQQK